MSLASPAVYEVYAIRYATVARKRAENFMAYDPHEGPMPMDYFIWVIRGAGRTVVVDTGFNREAAAQRKREFLRCPIESLRHLGIEPQAVADVILTHLHYDHAGNVKLLPNATIHLQEKELQYATGKYMKYDLMRHPYAVDDVVDVVRGVYDQRVCFYEGDAELADGIQLIHVGGHTQGLQAVRVHTQRGWVVLASDASHFYDNIHQESPFPIVFHVGDMLEGYGRLLRLAESKDHLVPGHDPLVMARYPRHGQPEHEIVALHQPPLE
ncbi:MAG TPA: N-acyl homoserine lactonase family protein [Burkholderiaceae bacterium]|nr:N-acyl homoserine lactonase family protein [Burkholderiaceae bacterium]